MSKICILDIKGVMEWKGDERENRLDLPLLPADRDTHKGGMVKVVVSLVPDGFIERRGEEGTTWFKATPISPIGFIPDECCI